MRILASLFFAAFSMGLLSGCFFNHSETLRVSGRLDTDIYKLSAKNSGQIVAFLAKEGDSVTANQMVVQLDTAKLAVQSRQLDSQNSDIHLNLDLLAAQKKQLRAEYNFSFHLLQKSEDLLAHSADTPQHRDELKTKVTGLSAGLDTVSVNAHLLASKRHQILLNRHLLALQIEDAKILSPVRGVIVNTFFKVGEWVAPGAVLAEVADLSLMTATVYVPLSDLPHLQLGSSVPCQVDGIDKPIAGKVRWISSESEFTPKTILTPETRSTLVYAVKIDIPNPDGALKIGMPIDAIFPK